MYCTVPCLVLFLSPSDLGGLVPAMRAMQVVVAAGEVVVGALVPILVPVVGLVQVAVGAVLQLLLVAVAAALLLVAVAAALLLVGSTASSSRGGREPAVWYHAQLKYSDSLKQWPCFCSSYTQCFRNQCICTNLTYCCMGRSCNNLLS